MKTELLKVNEDTVVEVTEDTQFILDLPNNKGEYSAEFMFIKEGVTAEVIGILNLKDGADVKLTTISHHKVPHTTCITNVRGVLNDGAKSDYIGKIIIAKEAQQTSSYLDDAVLVVGERTHNNSQPILMIDADDVKASHGATTGRIDENQIYYLTSRGLEREEAHKLIVTGFFESVLATIKDDNIRAIVERSLF